MVKTEQKGNLIVLKRWNLIVQFFFIYFVFLLFFSQTQTYLKHNMSGNAAQFKIHSEKSNSSSSPSWENITDGILCFDYWSYFFLTLKDTSGCLVTSLCQSFKPRMISAWKRMNGAWSIMLRTLSSASSHLNQYDEPTSSNKGSSKGISSNEGSPYRGSSKGGSLKGISSNIIK